MATVFLHAPQIFHNVCLLARTLEVFGQRECWVFDPNGLIRDHYGKVRTRELRNVSAGAFEKISWKRVEDPARVLDEHLGRVVAAVAEPSAVPLARFAFVSTDLLLFGSESRGLPEAVRAKSDAAITIPSHGVTQSLNLAVAAGVVLYEWQRQLERA